MSNEEWIELLSKAVKSKVKIQANHRFLFEGKKLGGFLVRVKRYNEVELLAEIEKTGLDLRKFSRKPIDVVHNYIDELSENTSPIKTRYQTRFNMYILPKKDILDEATIEKFNTVWKAKFNEDKTWENSPTIEERVEQWKKFRNDREKNTKKKWFTGLTIMGSNLYSWVYFRKTHPKKMKEIAKLFTKNEIRQLRREGFKFR